MPTAFSIFSSLGRFLKKIAPIIVIFVFALAIFLIYTKIREYSFQEIKRSLKLIPITGILLSIFFMICNYCVLIGYDWLALRAIGKKIENTRLALVSFVGAVISLNFGALLGGSSVRYRLYSEWGFSAYDIMRLILMLAVTFWIGALGLIGFLFLFFPPSVPDGIGLDFINLRILGFVLLSITVIYHAICYFFHKPIKILGKEFALPPFRIAIFQTLTAGADLIIACACLYALIPKSADLSFLQFLPSYLLATVAVVLTHVPGGAGVLELIVMNLTPEVSTSSIFAALLLFRLIYYILPLVIAAIVLVANELSLHKKDNNPLARWLRYWLPVIFSYFVFTAGLILTIVAVLPLHPSFLFRHTPLIILEISQILIGISGMLLLYYAFPLQYRIYKSYKIVVFTLAVGIVAVLAHSIKFMIVIPLVIILLGLILTKSSFKRKPDLDSEKYPLAWKVTASVILLTTGIFAFIFYNININEGFALGYKEMGARVLRTLFAQIIVLMGIFIYYGKRKLKTKLNKRSITKDKKTLDKIVEK